MHHDRLAFNRLVACLAVCGALSISAFTEIAAANLADGGDAAPHEGLQPGDAFADELSSGGHGPEMVVIPAGQFRMGCASDCSPGWELTSRSILVVVRGGTRLPRQRDAPGSVAVVELIARNVVGRLESRRSGADFREDLLEAPPTKFVRIHP